MRLLLRPFNTLELLLTFFAPILTLNSAVYLSTSEVPNPFDCLMLINIPLEPRLFIYTAVPATGSISRLALIVVTEGEPANPMTHLQEQQRCATTALRYEKEKAIVHTTLFFFLPFGCLSDSGGLSFRKWAVCSIDILRRGFIVEDTHR